MSRRASRLSTARMAVTSCGELLGNAYQLSRRDTLAAVVEVAKKTGLEVFVGVVVPASKRTGLMRDLDDAAADVAGTLGDVEARRPRVAGAMADGELCAAST